MSVTVIWFFVSVPVLSEHIIEQLPSVSTQSRRFTSTDPFAILRAAKESSDVTVDGSPWGIFAIIITRKPLTKISNISSAEEQFSFEKIQTEKIKVLEENIEKLNSFIQALRTQKSEIYTQLNAIKKSALSVRLDLCWNNIG